jgi:hypothetical protein
MKKKLAFALMLALAALVPQSTEARVCWIEQHSCYDDGSQWCCLYHCPSGEVWVCQ